MSSVNEMLQECVNDIVDYVLENGIVIVYSDNKKRKILHEDIIERTFLNGELVTLYDFMKILVNHDIKRLMSMEVKEVDDDEEEVRFTVDLGFRVICQQFGLKYDNTMIRKIFRMFQRRMSELFISDNFEVVEREEDIPTTEEEMDNVYDSLNEINKMYLDLCDITDTDWDELNFFTVKDWDRQTNDIEVKAEGFDGVTGICLNEIQIEIFEERVMDIYDELIEELLEKNCVEEE